MAGQMVLYVKAVKGRHGMDHTIAMVLYAKDRQAMVWHGMVTILWFCMRKTGKRLYGNHTMVLYAKDRHGGG